MVKNRNFGQKSKFWSKMAANFRVKLSSTVYLFTHVHLKVTTRFSVTSEHSKPVPQTCFLECLKLFPSQNHLSMLFILKNKKSLLTFFLIIYLFILTCIFSCYFLSGYSSQYVFVIGNFLRLKYCI